MPELPDPKDQDRVNQYLVTSVYKLVKDMDDFKEWEKMADAKYNLIENKTIELNIITERHENLIKWVMRIVSGIFISAGVGILGYIKLVLKW